MRKTLADIAPRTATVYPPPLDAATAGRRLLHKDGTPYTNGPRR